jgi:uncharacterized protein YwgA
MTGNGRNEQERCSDLILLLYLIEEHSRSSHRYLGITKADKFIFLAEKEMVEKEAKGFDYHFFKWHYGPLSPSIYADVSLLREAGMISPRDSLVLTKRGRQFLEQLDEILRMNRAFTDGIDRIVHQFSDATTDDITEYVYDVEIHYPMGPKRIREIPKGWDLVRKLPPRKAERSFGIPEPWINTIELLLDAEYSSKLDEVLERSSAATIHRYGEAG